MFKVKPALLLKPTFVIVSVPLVKVFSDNRTHFVTFKQTGQKAITVLTDFNIIPLEEI